MCLTPAHPSPPDRHVPETKDPKLALFELYLATAEKVSDRRAQANAWMLSVNSAIVALYGYLQSDKLAVPTGQKTIWLWAIPAAGALVCVAWTTLLTSYRKLNRAKFAVLQEIEADLPLQPFKREREVYTLDHRRALSSVETAIPVCFVLLYLAMLIAVAVTSRA
jgi:hypothetical protein